MFVRHEDGTIYATRGDAVFFTLEKRVGDELYRFQPGDVVRLKICKKKDPASVVLMKDFVIEAESTAVNIFLDRFEMKFGEITGKPVDYWYEAELNPDTHPDTFVGYDADGPAVFRLFPETKDVVEGELPDEKENAAVTRMVVTYVHEYLGENAETLMRESVESYIAAHPVKDGEDGLGVALAEIDDDKNLVLTYTDGSTAVVGHVGGEDGAPGKNGTNGVTFTPHVDSEGNLTWENFGGLENPAAVNIRGPAGAAGAPGKDGSDGADGRDGESGADGLTPQKGVDYFTEDDKTELEENIAARFGMPQSITFTRDGSAVQLQITESNGGLLTERMQLDAYDRPLFLECGDETCYFTWEGF